MAKTVDTTATGEVAQSGRLIDQFHDYMLAEARDSSENRGADVMDSQAEKILRATTEDEIWDADSGGTIQARDVPGLEVEVLSSAPIVSTRQDIVNSKGYYLNIYAVVLGGPEEILRKNGISVGEEVVLQTGAQLITSKIRTFEANGYLPVRGVIAATQTSSGNDVLRFKRLPQRVTAGSAE